MNELIQYIDKNLWLILIMGFPSVVMFSIFITTRIALKNSKRLAEEEKKRVEAEYQKQKSHDELLINALRGVVETQDEEIRQIRKHIF